MNSLYIDGRWTPGRGDRMVSKDPAANEIVWTAFAACPLQVEEAVAAARRAFPGWSRTPVEVRETYVRRFAEILARRKPELAVLIARETGKPLWECEGELDSMIGKVALSIAARAERAGEREQVVAAGRAVLRHRPHGVMAVLGPYNFPGHLPNGHIVPALLAGNCVVFKPSEITPAIGAAMVECWAEAGLPAGVINLVQGGLVIGRALTQADIDGLLFTGSARAGAIFRRQFADRPNVVLALELGGNNPLIVWDGDPEAAARTVVQSAFSTTGQRCSCARRLILPNGAFGDAVIEAAIALSDRLRIGAWNDADEPFMGPLVTEAAARQARAAQDSLIASGARVYRAMATDRPVAFVRPALLDVSDIAAPDEEIFAPVLQITRTRDFDDAMTAANATRFGLSAGLVTADEGLWLRFRNEIRAGVVNWNSPTTGASGGMPFGGSGDSGNHRPSAYYAADYCAYPVASVEHERLTTAVLKGVIA